MSVGVCRRCARRSRTAARAPAPAGRGAPPTQPHCVCRHHCAYPGRLRCDPLAPDVIEVCGSVERLGALLGRDVVAFSGVRRPSHYGLRCARSLAHEIATVGVTVAACEGDLGAAACAGALQAGGETILIGNPPGGRRVAALSMLALLADLVIVVEADERPSSLVAAEVAASRGVPVAAVPGPIDSASSAGSNRLIAEGVPVLCSAEQALDALAGVGADTGVRAARRPREYESLEPPRLPASPQSAAPQLEAGLAGVFERVRDGQDTLAKLCQGERDCDQPALALAELELTGLLRRGADGRYIPTAGHLR